MGSAASIRECRTGSQLLQLCTGPLGVDAVILELRDSDHCPTTPLIGQLASLCPEMPILAFAKLATAEMHDLVAAGRAGASDVVLDGVDDVLELVEQSLQRTAPARYTARLLREVADSVPPRLRSVVACCLCRGDTRLSVDDVSRITGVHPHTIARWLRECGLPSTNALLSWGRLLAACRHLDHSARSVEGVALELNFPSASALYNLARRYGGATPRQLHAAGGAIAITERLIEQIQAARTTRSVHSSDSLSDTMIVRLGRPE